VTYSLKGHVALVTGNSTGLGKAIGLRLGQAGAKVPVNYFNNSQRAQRTLDEYRDAGIDTVLVQADVTTAEGVEALFRAAEEKLGMVDIIIPNATCEQPLKPIEQYDWPFYQRMIDFFIKSPFLLTKRGLPHMKQKKWGRIINIVSEVYHRSVAPFSAYVAAKGTGSVRDHREHDRSRLDPRRTPRPRSPGNEGPVFFADPRRPLGRTRRCGSGGIVPGQRRGVVRLGTDNLCQRRADTLVIPG
jgi:NADP-dependent 3-hydroxy acid dehydrogenase YdfG